MSNPGLIPASAGQTSGVDTPIPTAWAHPRECGADVFTDGDEAGDKGSSPRVRGRLC